MTAKSSTSNPKEPAAVTKRNKKPKLVHSLNFSWFEVFLVALVLLFIFLLTQSRPAPSESTPPSLTGTTFP